MKKLVFIDFDDTLVNSLRAFCKVYNKRYQDSADWTKVRRYDMTDQCTHLGENFEGNIQAEILDIYGSSEFWRYLRPMKKANEILIKLKKEGYTLVMASIGDPANISKKIRYADANFPMFDQYLMLYTKKGKHSKGKINMHGAFMVDDNDRILRTTNASVKVVFGPEREYNSTYKSYKRCTDWEEVYHLIHSYFEKPNTEITKKADE